MKPLGSTDLKRLHRTWSRRTDGRVALLLDNVMTPVNVGSIVRSAAAYRVEALLLAGATASPDHPGARKTALGTDRYLSIRTYATALEAAAAARADGFAIVGIELADGAIPLWEVDLPSAVCLAVGHEDHGLSSACLGSCDVVACLPLLGKVGSLNVATAAAIALYEVRRQEWAAQPREGGEPSGP
jgi:tRNA (guanosine-2'-O-)-methyltransferase